MFNNTSNCNNNDKTQYPDVFILGVQKCGTTSLNSLLEYNNKICNKDLKEKHFYSERNFTANYTNYDMKFIDCKRSQLTFDATPNYIFFDDTAINVKNSYTSLSLSLKKFIVLLREPVSRDYSEYQRTLRICFNLIDDSKKLHKNGSIYELHSTIDARIHSYYEKCIDIMKNMNTTNIYTKLNKDNAFTFAEWSNSSHGLSQRSRGLYLHQLQNWLKYIKRNQLFIMNFETLVVNTTDTILRLSSFLNISHKGIYFYCYYYY